MSHLDTSCCNVLPAWFAGKGHPVNLRGTGRYCPSFSLHSLERCLELGPGRQRHNSTTEHLCCAAGNLFPSSFSPNSTPAREQLPLPAIATATILNNPGTCDSLQADHPHAGTPRGNSSCTMAGCRNTEYFFPWEFLQGYQRTGYKELVLGTGTGTGIGTRTRMKQSPATHLGGRVVFYFVDKIKNIF